MLKKKTLIILISILFLVLIVCLGACRKPEQKVFIVEEVENGLIILGISEEYHQIEELNFPISIYHNKKDKKVVEIGDGAFKDYTNLKRVYLSDDVIRIGKEAFSGCLNLESINLPTNLLEIREKAFFNTGLSGINLESKNIKIEKDAFSNSKNLIITTGCREINKPKEWSNDAFNDVKAVYWNFIITNEGIAAGVKILPLQSEYVAYSDVILDFSEIEDLSSYDVFSNGKPINVNNKKATIRITEDIIITLLEKDFTSIYEALNYEKIDGGLAVTGFKEGVSLDNSSNLIFPKNYTLDGENLEVIEISDGAFANSNIYIREITVSGNIKKIGNEAFKGFDFGKITIKGVEEIGDRCFASNKRLITIEISSSLEKIGEGAFSDCLSIKEIDLSNTKVEIIKSNTFENMSELFSLKLPSNLKTLESSSIIGCPNLKTLALPDNIENIGSPAIVNCDTLEKINIPSKYIPKEEEVLGWGGYLPVFGLCKNLTTIEGESNDKYTVIGNALIVDNCLLNLGVDSQIPNGVKEIKEIAPIAISYNKTPKIVVPSSVKSIGFAAFWGFKGQILDLSQTTEIKEIPEAFLGTVEGAEDISDVECVILPNTITQIGNEAFANCKNLTSIKFSSEDEDGFSIPNTITDIGEYVFANCNLLKIRTNCKKEEKPVGWSSYCFEWAPEENIIWNE
ncbi:MAG TPA: leucine-rich repeat domain-containing protein [Clostridiales bacterium]|nr:leucine-rich repeat domain-containing protein [Clostridiales bacterium]